MKIQISQENLELMNRWGKCIQSLTEKGIISKNKFPVEETKKVLYQLKNKKYFSLIKNKDNPLGEILDNENRKITGR